MLNTIFFLTALRSTGVFSRSEASISAQDGGENPMLLLSERLSLLGRMSSRMRGCREDVKICR